MTLDGFEVDPQSIEQFGSTVLAELRDRVDALHGRLAATAVPGHTYTSTEPGHVALDGHRAVVDGFGARLGLAGQQLHVLAERLHRTAAEYRERDSSGADRVTQAGSGLDQGG